MSVEPWTPLGETVVARDRWIDLRRERVRTPADIEIDDFYVLHYADWVTAVAVTSERRFVLTRQWRQGARTVSLEFAGGIIEPGEAMEAAAARELQEETGYAGAPGVRLQTIWANPASHTNRVHAVLIPQAEKTSEPRFDGIESLETQEMDAAALLAAVRSGEMGHSLHLAAVLALVLHRPELLAPGA